MAVYSEAWDEDGRLWKFGHATMMSLPQLPATIIGGQFVYDLLQGGYVFDFALGGPGDYMHTSCRPTRPKPSRRRAWSPISCARRGSERLEAD